MDSHETTIYTAVLIAGSIIGVIIIYFFISIIGHQRRNQALYKSKILAEITTLEKERARVAADLHDELGPLLASVKFKASSLDVTDEEDKQTLEKISNNLNDLITRIRSISNDLVPHSLLRKGLIVAMEESVTQMNKQNNLEIKFAHQHIPELPQEKSVNLYRILQEIIHNTIKHSKAANLRIEMKMDDQNLIVLTEDDGIGFDYNAKTKEASGLGLRNLLSRTEVLGGSMYLDSKEAKGTRYTFEIPL